MRPSPTARILFLLASLSLADILRERGTEPVDRWLRAFCEQSWSCDREAGMCYKDAQTLCYSVRRYTPVTDGALYGGTMGPYHVQPVP